VQDGLRFTYFWIKEQIEKEKTQGIDIAAYGSSKVVSTQAPVQLGSLRAADGNEGLWVDGAGLVERCLLAAGEFGL
jgi:GDP-D-mannose 3', 5'-epimerase